MLSQETSGTKRKPAKKDAFETAMFWFAHLKTTDAISVASESWKNAVMLFDTPTQCSHIQHALENILSAIGDTKIDYPKSLPGFLHDKGDNKVSSQTQEGKVKTPKVFSNHTPNLLTTLYSMG